MYHVAVENDRSRLVTFGRAIATIRAAIGLTQAVLGRRIGRSQAYVSMLERGRLTSVRFTDAEAICRALGATLVFGVESPLLRSPTRQRDRAHAHCVAYVARRLEVNGWTVRREVEVGDPAWPGWVDVLAYHPATRTLLIVEVKTELHDVGDVERRLSWYERRAGAAAQSFGWHPKATVGCLLLLGTHENDRRVQENRRALDSTFPLRARDVALLVADGVVPGTGTAAGAPARGLAMMDPRSRGRRWVRATTSEGRRSAAPYRDYADFVRADTLQYRGACRRAS